jgi:hypothetical protein
VALCSAQRRIAVVADTASQAGSYSVEARAADADHVVRVAARARVTDDRCPREGEALSTYMGHANISITLDRHGHLFPGNEDEAAALLDAVLVRVSEDAARASLAPVCPDWVGFPRTPSEQSVTATGHRPYSLRFGVVYDI